MREDFTGQLSALGINPGDVVLMHSSMKALGTERTPEEFIQDILSALGPQGTLMLPAFSYGSVTAEHPHYSARESEPCIGLLPRCFFRMPGVVRSLHPTHSVCAYGRLAKKLTAEHILDETPVGPHSPIMKMLEYDGKILFIGDILTKCTFMHGVEEMAGAPYSLSDQRRHYVLEDENGNIIEKDMFPHGFVQWRQAFYRIGDILAYPDIKTGKVGQADCYLIDARALLAKALEKFKEDMYFFAVRR